MGWHYRGGERLNQLAMNAAYQNAALPEPYRILGRKLLPFSLGHYMLLRRFDCAFIADEERIPELADLIFGVLICERNYRQGERLVNDADAFTKASHELGKSNEGIEYLGLIEKIKLFKDYIKDGSQMPPYWNESRETRISGQHWSQSMLVSLMSELGYSRIDALNAPLTQVMADYLALAENNGSIRLMTESEILECQS